MGGRRIMLKTIGAAVAALAAFGIGAASAFAEAPAPSKVTPELIAAGTKEGQVVWYSAAELGVSEAIAKSFEAKYPGIKVQVERTGSERVFQRVGQEYSSEIHAVDVVNSSDASHYIIWKRQGWL